MFPYAIGSSVSIVERHEYSDNFVLYNVDTLHAWPFVFVVIPVVVVVGSSTCGCGHYVLGWYPYSSSLHFHHRMTMMLQLSLVPPIGIVHRPNIRTTSELRFVVRRSIILPSPYAIYEEPT